MSSKLIKNPGQVDHPEKKLKEFLSFIGLQLSEIHRFSKSTPKVSPKESSKDAKLLKFLNAACHLSNETVKQIQKKLYYFDKDLLLENEMRPFDSEGRYEHGEPAIRLPGLQKPIPFCDVPNGYALWQEPRRFSFETPEKDQAEIARKKAERKRRKLVQQTFFMALARIVKEKATPKQWQIVRRFFINASLQKEKTSLKDMAEEFNLPSSTLHQQLWGRSRNGKRIGGVFRKAIRKLRRNPEIMILLKKEKRLLNAFVKELFAKNNRRIEEYVNYAEEPKEETDDSGIYGEMLGQTV